MKQYYRLSHPEVSKVALSLPVLLVHWVYFDANTNAKGEDYILTTQRKIKIWYLFQSKCNVALYEFVKQK